MDATLLPDQVAALIRGRITDGTYPAGSVLPPHRLLVKELGVSGSTINLAYRVLRAQGYLLVIPGRGTVVLDPLNSPQGPAVLARTTEGPCETWPSPGSNRDTVKRVTATIRDRITDGTYPPDQRIPTLAQLSAEFNARTWLVREALAALKNEGLLYSLSPKGHFVHPDAAGTRAAGNLAGQDAYPVPDQHGRGEARGGHVMLPQTATGRPLGVR
ncbi:winged helix-turn-helix domain-containing protein (plasmid) [Streptomyces sp. NBC_00445]|uniref:winged helix-turn-helix domain-containing protein n=1 Tax=Streptomyces sp. NBC_00445 TaxID=2975745 RepID=UPI002E2302E1